MGGFVIQPEPVAIGHYVAVFPLREGAPRDSANAIFARACATVRSRRCSARGTSGTTRQAQYFQRALASAPDGRDREANGASAIASAATYLPALLRAAGITLLLSCLAMLLAVSLGVVHRRRPRLRSADRARAAHRVRRGRARHAGAAAALRHLLRTLGRRASAGVRRGGARTRPQLRRVRVGDLSLGARGDRATAARGGAHARALRVSDSATRARTAGAAARAGADDERLRRAAQGFVARVGDHRRRAHEADGDLRDERRKLGRARHAVRARVSRALAAALARGARLERRWSAT